MNSTKRKNMAAVIGISLLLILTLYSIMGIHESSTFAYPISTQIANSGNYTNGYPGPTSNDPLQLSYPAPNQSVNGNSLATPQSIETYNFTSGWPTPTPNAFPSSNTPRQGVAPAGGMNTISERHVFGSWGYHWTFNVPDPYPSNIEHVPMIAWDTWQVWKPSVSQIQTSAARTPHNYWLVFNECDHQSQCNTSPSVAAEFYYNQLVHTMFDQSISGGQLGADPDADLIVGGVNAHPCGIRWLSEFVEAYRDITEQELGEPQDPPRAGWHFHLYPEIYPEGWTYENEDCSGNWDSWDYDTGSTHAWRLEDFNEWRRDAMNILYFIWQYGRPEDEVWITEMGCLPGFQGSEEYSHYCPNEAFMAGYVANITGWLNNEGRWIARYAWYTDWDATFPWDYTELYEVPPPTPSPHLSDLGNYYSQVQPSSSIKLPWPTVWLPMVHGP